METTIVRTEVMNKIVTCHVLILTSSASRVEDVFSIVGDVTAMQIVKMEVMKIQQYAVSF